jgi:hypothetical protein
VDAGKGPESRASKWGRAGEAGQGRAVGRGERRRPKNMAYRNGSEDPRGTYNVRV